jgi:hypothetical protein
MSMPGIWQVSCLFRNAAKNVMFGEGKRQKVQGVTENVLSHKKAQKAQKIIFRKRALSEYKIHLCFL